MKSYRTIQTLRKLRQEVVWNLLNANTAPEIIGILHTLLNEKIRRLPASVLTERVALDLEELRSNGEHLPETAQQYIANWYGSGFLRRDKLPGDVEEMYELTSGAISAIHFALSIDRPQTSATESHLSLVIREISKLADDTDTDKARRLRRLADEKKRIDREMEAIESGSVRVLPYNVALERIREIINLASDLTGDFRRVRDQASDLHQELRERVMSHEGGRGEVLQLVFEGIDRIANSDPGRTFTAFWQLLNDPEQSSALDEELDELLRRKFTADLSQQERAMLRTIKRNLLDQSGNVMSEFKYFSESLEKYVRSTDYLEQRRMTALIKEAQRTAIDLVQVSRPFDLLDFYVSLSSPRIKTMSVKMHDPDTAGKYVPMADAEESTVSLSEVAKSVAESDIDMRTLRANIADVLSRQPSATIADILRIHPAKQALGSVLGLVEIGSKHGVCVEDEREVVEWIGFDGVHRSGNIPQITFVRGIYK